MRAALLLLPALMLAGCNSQPAATSPAGNEAAGNEVSDKGGVERLFNAPSDAIASLNQFGFHLGDYKAATDGYAAKGVPVTMSQSDAASPNTATVEVMGSDAQAVDRIVFTLSLTDNANADTAKKRLAEIVTGFLFQYGIDNSTASSSIIAERDTAGQIDDAPFAVATQREAGKSDAPRRLTVTLQRPNSPASPQPAAQNITQP